MAILNILLAMLPVNYTWEQALKMELGLGIWHFSTQSQDLVEISCLQSSTLYRLEWAHQLQSLDL